MAVRVLVTLLNHMFFLYVVVGDHTCRHVEDVDITR